MQPSSATAPRRHRAGIPGFFAGFSYPFRALVVIQQTRRLWQYVLIPILINIVLGALLYGGLLLPGLQRIDQTLAGLPVWLAFLDPLLSFLFGLVLLVLLGVALLTIGTLLGAWWYSQLSEQLEIMRTGTAIAAPPPTFWHVLREIGYALGFELKKLLLLVGIGGPLLLLNLMPPPGALIGTIGTLLLMALLVTLDAFEPMLSRRRRRFRTKLATFWRLFPASIGFGAVCLLLVSIPLFNLLSIPLCIAAGTLFLCDYDWKKAGNFLEGEA
ncbi:MAG: hypothetical protein HC914_05920 [Chloroflexaceae bacterium]|nr:hypothetical protein [Chloroflexaceae bacterium]